MNRKEKKVSYDFSEDYKDLPQKMRTRVNLTARELLELQKKTNALLENTGDRSLEEERRN